MATVPINGRNPISERRLSIASEDSTGNDPWQTFKREVAEREAQAAVVDSNKSVRFAQSSIGATSTLAPIVSQSSGTKSSSLNPNRNLVVSAVPVAVIGTEPNSENAVSHLKQLDPTRSRRWEDLHRPFTVDGKPRRFLGLLDDIGGDVPDFDPQSDLTAPWFPPVPTNFVSPPPGTNFTITLPGSFVSRSVPLVKSPNSGRVVDRSNDVSCESDVADAHEGARSAGPVAYSFQTLMGRFPRLSDKFPDMVLRNSNSITRSEFDGSYDPPHVPRDAVSLPELGVVANLFDEAALKAEMGQSTPSQCSIYSDPQSQVIRDEPGRMVTSADDTRERSSNGQLPNEPRTSVVLKDGVSPRFLTESNTSLYLAEEYFRPIERDPQVSSIVPGDLEPP